MNLINYISQIIIPFLFAIIVVHGFLTGTDLFSSFIEGAQEGLKTVIGILPSLIGLILAVGIFRSSGAMDILLKLFSPISSVTGFPSELTSLSLTKMFSSSAATGILIDIFKNYGPDSLIGIASSIMMSSTETVFYTLSIYSASAGVKDTRYTVVCAIIANLAGIICSYIIAIIFFK